MTQRTPNLELPAAKRSGSTVSARLIVLQLVLIVVLILSLFISRDQGAPGPVLTGEPIEPARVKEIAVRLENLNLHKQAADTWEEYLKLAVADRFESGRYRVRIGKLRQQQGDYASALNHYLHAEVLLDETDTKLQREIDMNVRECLRRRGQYAELAREIAARAADDPDASAEQGQQVVAQIGPQKITVSDFDRMLADEIELLVKSQVGMSPEQEDELRKRLFERFSEPSAKAQQLQQMVTSRVLADEARRRGLQESADFRAQLVAMADSLLASQLMLDEVSQRATVTDADVQRYFETNKDRYQLPASTSIAHIQCDTQAEAAEVMALLDEGESFGDLAKRKSRDLSTQESGGVLRQPVMQGAGHPIFGSDPALVERITNAQPDTVLSEPIQTDRGWHVVKVIAHQEAETPPLDEVRDRVRRDTMEARRREVTDQYLSQILQDAQVRFYPEVLRQGDTKASAQ